MAFFSEKTAKSLKSRGALPGDTPAIEFISTGLWAADLAIGGGFARQRVTELTGEFASSKTTLALLSASKVIANGGYVALLETESGLDMKWLETLGIFPDEIYMGEDDKDIEDYHLHIWHPPYLENGLETLLTLYKEDVYDLIIFDSFGGSPVRAAVESTLEDVIMMKRARVGSQFKELFMANAHKGHAAVVLINQVYTNSQQPYYDALKPQGGYVVSNGGKSIPFLSALRIFMKDPLKVATEKDETTPDGEKIKKGTIIGKEHGGMIFKNKTGKKVPSHFKFRLMTFPESFINFPWDIVESALEAGVIEQRGHFWYYQDQQVAKSRMEMEVLVSQSNEFTERIERDLFEFIHTRKAKENDPVTDLEELDAPAFPGDPHDPEFQAEVS